MDLRMMDTLQPERDMLSLPWVLRSCVHPFFSGGRLVKHINSRYLARPIRFDKGSKFSCHYQRQR